LLLNKGYAFAAFAGWALVEMEILLFPNCRLSLFNDQ